MILRSTAARYVDELGERAVIALALENDGSPFQTLCTITCRGLEAAGRANRPLEELRAIGMPWAGFADFVEIQVVGTKGRYTTLWARNERHRPRRRRAQALRT